MPKIAPRLESLATRNLSFPTCPRNGGFGIQSPGESVPGAPLPRRNLSSLPQRPLRFFLRQNLVPAIERLSSASAISNNRHRQPYARRTPRCRTTSSTLQREAFRGRARRRRGTRSGPRNRGCRRLRATCERRSRESCRRRLGHGASLGAGCRAWSSLRLGKGWRLPPWRLVRGNGVNRACLPSVAPRLRPSPDPRVLLLRCRPLVAAARWRDSSRAGCWQRSDFGVTLRRVRECRRFRGSGCR